MLRPAQVKHTMAVLRPEWYHLSPAVGCAATAGDAVLSNMYRTVSTTRESPFLAACDVARELFHSAGGGAPRPARTRSRAAGHLDAGDLGALCAQALAGAPEDDAKALRSRGVESNRKHGDWTGVSLARYLRLVDRLRAAKGFGCAVVARRVWASARDRGELLDFLVGVDGAVPVFARGAPDPRSWADDAFPDEPDAAAVAAATAAVLASDAGRSSTFAANYEVLACSLASAGCLRRPRRAATRVFGNAEKMDCVEACVREICDLVLYDGAAFDASRLPAAAPARRFYDAGGDGDAWFALCQGLPGCSYLAATAAGDAFELAPRMDTVALAASTLLGVEEATTLEALADNWNSRVGCARSPSLVADASRSGSYTPPLGEAPRVRAVGDLWLDSGATELEIVLEEHPPVALSAVRRVADAWTDDARRRHLDAFLGRGESVLDALVAPLLGDALLAALPADASAEKKRLAILAARLAASDARAWAPASEAADRGSRDDVARAADRAREARVAAALRVAASDAALAGELLPTLLAHADHLDARGLARALRGRAGVYAGDAELLASRPDVARYLAEPPPLERVRRFFEFPG